jgi:hypothetical protein
VSILAGAIPATEYLACTMPQTLGNISVGVLIVSRMTFGQVKEI